MLIIFIYTLPIWFYVRLIVNMLCSVSVICASLIEVPNLVDFLWIYDSTRAEILKMVLMSKYILLSWYYAELWRSCPVVWPMSVVVILQGKGRQIICYRGEAQLYNYPIWSKLVITDKFGIQMQWCSWVDISYTCNNLHTLLIRHALMQ